MKHATGFGGLGSIDSYSSIGTQRSRRHVVPSSCNETERLSPIDNAAQCEYQCREPLLMTFNYDTDGTGSAPAVHKKDPPGVV
mgnify:CR=1 FL=1